MEPDQLNLDLAEGVSDEVAAMILDELAKQDLRTATKRTVIPAFWLMLIAGIVTKLTGWVVEVDDLLPWSPIIAVAGGVLYRASRWLEGRFPTLGWIIFGDRSQPTY